TYSIFRGTQDGTATLEGNVVTYTPNAGFSGFDEFDFQASDGILESNLGVVQMDVQYEPPSGGSAVTPPDPAPSASILTPQEDVYAGTPITLQATASDDDGPSAITDIEWDFNYDGTTFQADPTASGTLTPTYTFASPVSISSSCR